MKTNTQTKWVPRKISFRRPLYKMLAFVLLALVIGVNSFFGLNFITGGISGALLMVMLFAIQESGENTPADNVNSLLESYRTVQSSEGKPELVYDEYSQLIAVRLSGKEYQNPASYSNYGDDIYIAQFETENGWLVIVIEDPNTKNQNALAYRRVTEEQ